MKNRKTTLDFTPFSQADVNALLAAVPSSDGKIKAYKVNSWFNADTKEIIYGLSCQNTAGEWAFVCNGKRALIFSDKSTANKVCREFKKSLNAAVA